MKTIILTHFLLAILVTLISAHDSNSTEDHHSCSSEDHSDSHSCETCEEKFKYKCNKNEWVQFLLDEAPAEYGVYVGDSQPGIPIFVGGHFPSKYPVGISIINPKGAYMTKPQSFLNDSSELFYLKKDCHHRYEWVNSSHGEFLDYALQAFEENAVGAPFYISRKVFDEYTVAFAVAIISVGTANYISKEGVTQDSTEYQVLTCKSKVFETPPETTTPGPEIPDPNYTGCVHKWQTYNNDDEPARRGIAAGLYDIDNMAYVGKANDGYSNRFATVLLQQPGAGVYTSFSGNSLFISNGGSFLVDNPNYTYYWADSFRDDHPSNAVKLKIGGSNSLSLYVGRVQVDGQTFVGSIGPSMGLYYIVPNKPEHLAWNYQVLLCDPKPSNPCKQVWMPYKNDDAPSKDGFLVDFYENGIQSYVGRSDNKRIVGHDYVIGRVQIAPSNDSGVYTLQSVSGGEKFDPHHGEYLVKNSDDLYEWVNAHTGEEVKNALKVPVTHASDCCDDGHHTEDAFIGKFYLDNVVYIGTVYQRQGLAFVDVDGKKKVVSSFQVLTCASAEKFEEEEKHHDCHCDHKCLDDEKFFYE